MAATRKRALIRAERLETRVTAETKALCTKAADLQGRTLSEFVVSSALEAARNVLRESEFTELTYRDRVAFVEALIQAPVEPNDRLRQAMKRHRQVFSTSRQ